MRSLLNLERRGSFENPSTPLSSAALLTMLGGSPTEAGVQVSEESSMSYMAVYRCVHFLAGLVAGLPIKVYRTDAQNAQKKTEINGTPVANLLQMPKTGLTPFELWELVMVHLLLWGNAYILKIRDGYGSIVGLKPIHPRRVQPKWHADNWDNTGMPAPMPLDDTDVEKVFVVQMPNNATEPLTPYEIMHIPGLSYDGLIGLSPIAAAKQVIGIGLAADKLSASLYGNGALQSGILTTDKELTQTESDDLKRRWREKNAGINHAHDVSVLGSGAKFQPTTLPPEAMQFLQSRRWQTIEIARMYGVPPHLVGDVERTTSWGTGIEQQNIAFVSYTLRAWLVRIEQRLNREVVTQSTQYSEFLVDGLLRGSTLERYQAYASAISAGGWLTRNEARAKENLPPIDGLDEPVMPVMPPAGSIGGDEPIPGAGGTPQQEDPAGSDQGAPAGAQ